MSEYRRVDGGKDAGDAKLEQVKAYRLEPGHAGVYDVGAIHAIDYLEAGDTRHHVERGDRIVCAEILRFEKLPPTLIGTTSSLRKGGCRRLRMSGLCRQRNKKSQTRKRNCVALIVFQFYMSPKYIGDCHHRSSLMTGIIIVNANAADVR